MQIMQLNKIYYFHELAAAAAQSAIGGGSMVHRLTSTWGFINWRRRRMAAVPGTSGVCSAFWEIVVRC